MSQKAKVQKKVDFLRKLTDNNAFFIEILHELSFK